MPKKRDGLTPRRMALECARAAHRTKADRITVLNVSRVFPLADYFVIVSCTSRIHAKSVAAEIENTLAARGARPFGVEGLAEGGWILLDYADVVVHIFLEEIRAYYDLEILWGDARSIKWR